MVVHENDCRLLTLLGHPQIALVVVASGVHTYERQGAGQDTRPHVCIQRLLHLDGRQMEMYRLLARNAPAQFHHSSAVVLDISLSTCDRLRAELSSTASLKEICV